MILTKSYLYKLCDYMEVILTNDLEEELLAIYGTEPDEIHIWSEQDIYEQVRKRIIRYYKL